MTMRAIPASAIIRARLTLLQFVLARYGWLALLIGYATITLFGPGGGDAFNFYVRPHWSRATAPAWVFLFTAPATPLGWPLRWTALVVVSVLGAVWARRATGDQRWWIPVMSHSFVVNIWLGQIEVVALIGVGLAWLVMQKKLHPAWLGIAMLGLLAKIQVGAGLALLFAFWIWREQGLRPLIIGAAASLAVVAATLVIYPGWPADYLVAIQTLAPQDQIWNGAIFPYGLLLIPVALYPGDVGKIRRARMFACITLLASPYFAWYHPATAMLLETRVSLMWLSWVDALPRIFLGYKRNGWLLPLVMVCWDVWQIWRERRAMERSAAKP